MNNLNVKIKMIKSIYMIMGNHTRGHYDTIYMLLEKRDKIAIKLIQTLKSYKININNGINMK